MKELIQALVELLKIKSLITLLMTSTLSYLALTGSIEIETFTIICGSIVTFYFTKKSDKNEIIEDNIEELINKIIDKKLNKEIIEKEDINE